VNINQLARSLATMTIFAIALGTVLRLTTRCEWRTLWSLDRAKITACAIHDIERKPLER
jgi:hypothetical protein